MRHPLNCHFIYDIDLFGKEPELYYKGRNKKSTLIGRIFTILYALIYLAFFAYKLYRMLIKEDVTFYQTTAFTGEVPKIHLTNEIFYGGFALANAKTLQPFIDESIYYIVLQFRTGERVNNIWNWKVELMELEICNLSKFNPDYYDLFKDKPMGNMYCPKNMDVILQGHTTYDVYSYFHVGFYPCVNTTTRQNCKSPEVIDQYLKNTYVSFKMQDIELTPQIYSSPVQLRGKEVNSPASKNLFQNINAYFQIIELETDNDIVGFEGLSNIQKKKYLKYDGPIVLSRLNDNTQYQAGQSLCDVTVQLTEQVLTIKRTYTKLIEVLGDVGGLMEVIFMAFKLIATLITDLLYEKSLVNHLFEFDLDKKLVIIKELKIMKKRKESIKRRKSIEMPKESIKEDIIIYNGDKNSVKASKFKPSYSKEDFTVQTKNKLNNDEALLKSNNNLKEENDKKNKKKKKLKTIINNNIISENEFKNIELSELRKIDTIQTDKGKKKGAKNSKAKSADKEKTIKSIQNIITKIKYNKFCVCCCFLCAKKRKNVQNILVDEGMDIIIQNLDILNIFNKIYRDGKIVDNIKNHSLKMTDECINKLLKFNAHKE